MNFIDLYNKCNNHAFIDLNSEAEQCIKLFQLYGQLNPDGSGSLFADNITDSNHKYLFLKSFANGGGPLRGLISSKTKSKFTFRLLYNKTNNKGIILTGFVPTYTVRQETPQTIKTYFKSITNYKCIMCGRTAREIDHKYDFKMHWYSDYNFNVDPNNYQLLCQSCNSRKREERNIQKTDNRKFNLNFITTRGSFNDSFDTFTIENKFPGDFLTDAAETKRLDYIYYSNYFNKFKEINNNLNHEIYTNEYIPLINELLINDFCIENYDEIVFTILRQ